MEYLSWEKGNRRPHGMGDNEKMVASRTVVLSVYSGNSWFPKIFSGNPNYFPNTTKICLLFSFSFSHKSLIQWSFTEAHNV